VGGDVRGEWIIMKFSLISDMHVNHPQLKTPYDKLEEIIVVAGDTSDDRDWETVLKI